MKFLYIAGLIFAFFQGSLLPYVLAEGFFVVLASFYFGEEKLSPKILAFLFSLGLIFDLVQSQTLGLSSLIFLLAGSLLFAMRRQVFAGKPVFLAGVVALINITRSQLMFGQIFVVSCLIAFLLSFVIFVFFWQRPRDFKII